MNESKSKPDPQKNVSESVYSLLIDCGSEERQRELFERLTAEGWPCRVYTL
jgi:hypothetical protein